MHSSVPCENHPADLQCSSIYWFQNETKERKHENQWVFVSKEYN